MSIESIRTLRLLMPISAICSSIAQGVAVFTNEWLYTTEFMPNQEFQKFKMPPEMEYHRKHTTSGLWMLCSNEPPELRMHCTYIDYFRAEEYIPDQNDSTMAIPYAIKSAAIYIFASCAILFMGELIYLCRKTFGHRQIYTFISGITFILAGLTILAGLVVYISTFKGEVSNKLRPLSEFQEALFHFRYGYSFLMMVASLVLCEISGTLSIFLYIAQKRFEIMIDTEREEVLKKNILNLFAPNNVQRKSSNGLPSRKDFLHEPPMLRIVLEDENGSSIAGPNYAAVSAGVNPNFLTPEFGFDAAFYCGRHGSRGRRHSRSNESFLGSAESTRSRRNSFASFQDNSNQVSPISSPRSSFAVMRDNVNEHDERHKGIDENDHNRGSVNKMALPNRDQHNPSVMRELHVPALMQRPRFNEMRASQFVICPPLSLPANSTSPYTHFTKNSEFEQDIPCVIPLSESRLAPPQNNLEPHMRSRSNSRQVTGRVNLNRSTLV